MTNLLRCLLALLLLSLARPLLAQAPPPPPPPAPDTSHWRDEKATLSGTVTDETGAKLKKARLSFTATATGKHVETTSDRSGHYKIAMQLGVYRVEVAARRLMPLTTEVTLSQNAVKDFVVGGPESDSTAASPH